MSFLFGESGNPAEAFRGYGYQDQGKILNNVLTGNLLGSQPGYTSSLDAQIAQLQNQINGYQPQLSIDNQKGKFGTWPNNFSYYDSKGLYDLNSQLTALQQQKAAAEGYQQQQQQNALPDLTFSQYSPYQFSAPNFNAQTAVGDAFTPMANNLENIFNRRQAEQLKYANEDLNKRGLYQSGAAIENTNRIQRDVGDSLSNALAQLAGQQAQQQLGATQFQAQMEAQRELNQAAELFRAQGMSDQQATQAAQYALQKRNMENGQQQQQINNLMQLYGYSTGATPANQGSSGFLGGLGSAALQLAPMFL